jgi:hypothetical protein
MQSPTNGRLRCLKYSRRGVTSSSSMVIQTFLRIHGSTRSFWYHTQVYLKWSGPKEGRIMLITTLLPIVFHDAFTCFNSHGKVLEGQKQADSLQRCWNQGRNRHLHTDSLPPVCPVEGNGKIAPTIYSLHLHRLKYMSTCAMQLIINFSRLPGCYYQYRI